MSRLASGRPLFRADHVGSLLHPAALRQAYKQHVNGSIPDEAFEKIQDDKIIRQKRFRVVF